MIFLNLLCECVSYMFPFFSAWDCPSYAIGMFYHSTTSQPLHIPLWLKDQCLLKKTSNQTKERKQFADFSNDEFRAAAL